nr:hypothetical protein [Tanacetum cinerariifolium]
MRDENPIRTLGDYSKSSHEGYRNTIDLPVGNNVVVLKQYELLSSFGLDSQARLDEGRMYSRHLEAK